MDRCLKAAWFLVIAPLVIGATIFIAWLVLRLTILGRLGILTIYAGTLCAVLGAGFLAAYLWRARRDGSVPNRRLLRQAILWIAVCGFDFVAAGGLAWTAIRIETCYTVVIQNQSGLQIDDVLLSGGGVNVTIGTISHGQTIRQRLWFSQDGALILTATQHERMITTTVEGYVTGSFGGYATVTYLGPGELIVERRVPGP